MRTITGTKHKTITLNAGELTKFVYDNTVTVDLYNASSKDIWMSGDPNINAQVRNEDCMLLPADGGAYNGFRPTLTANTEFTVIAEETACIVVVVKGW